MKRKFISIAAVTAVLLSVLVTACSKDGATGPAGAAGANGPAGPTGPQGPQGNSGSANVTYSNWAYLPFKADTATVNGKLDTAGFYYNWAITAITADIINKGDVRVYMNLNTPTQPVVVSLPYFSVYDTGSLDINYQVGGVGLYGTFYPSNGTAGAQFRYVIIPGGTVGRTAANGSKIDWNNYSEVKAYLGLKD